MTKRGHEGRTYLDHTPDDHPECLPTLIDWVKDDDEDGQEHPDHADGGPGRETLDAVDHLGEEKGQRDEDDKNDEEGNGRPDGELEGLLQSSAIEICLRSNALEVGRVGDILDGLSELGDAMNILVLLGASLFVILGGCLGFRLVVDVSLDGVDGAGLGPSEGGVGFLKVMVRDQPRGHEIVK